MNTKLFDIIILTDSRYVNPKELNNYNKTVLLEDRLVYDALEKEGLKVHRLAWDDPYFDWSNTNYVIFRTTWDYFDRFTEFSEWLNTVSKQTKLLNSEAIIRWNIDKHYLLDLQKSGVTIAKTHFIEKGTATSLKVIHNTLAWTQTVLKPCVSGAARHTYKLNPDNLGAHEAIFQELITKEALMLQPFQHNIVSQGEISMMVFNGQFTHAILKKVKAGDFRVQDDFGGSVHDYIPTKEEIKFAENCVKSCFETPIYARVDIFTDNDGNIALAELELIEPELWFRHHHKAAAILAKAIKNKF